jgi:hypothetical protein
VWLWATISNPRGGWCEAMSLSASRYGSPEAYAHEVLVNLSRDRRRASKGRRVETIPTGPLNGSTADVVDRLGERDVMIQAVRRPPRRQLQVIRAVNASRSRRSHPVPLAARANCVVANRIAGPRTLEKRKLSPAAGAVSARSRTLRGGVLSTSKSRVFAPCW